MNASAAVCVGMVVGERGARRVTTTNTSSGYDAGHDDDDHDDDRAETCRASR